jgi:hypothetical protein
MKCRRLVNGDITGGRGLSDFAVGDEGTAQSVTCELKLLLGEWFLDTSRGEPWWRHPDASARTVLGTHPADLSYAEACIKAAILRVPGVAKLTGFSLAFNHNTRAATVSATGRFDSGAPFSVQEVLL